MNYQNHYDRLISRSQLRERPEGYLEKHHIVPKCLGGTNEKYNIVLLTPEEHYVAHQLLVKINPNNIGLNFSAINMCAGNQNQVRNNKLYGWLRKRLSENKKGQTKENNTKVALMATKLTGRTKETHEYLQKISLKMLGRTKENNEGIRLMAEKLTGRTKETHHYLTTMSEKLKGRTKETHPGIQKQSDKIRGRTKENNEGIRLTAEKLTGRTKETHLGIQKQANKIRGRCILNNNERQVLLEKRNQQMTFKEISNYFLSIGIKIQPDGIRKIYLKILENYQFKN